MPKEEKITRKEGVRAEVAPSRSVKKLFSLAHEKATRAIVSVSLAAALASCSPAVSQAQDTTPAKGKPVAAAVEKQGVTYETIADLKELQPYLDNAKDKLVTLTSRKDVKKLGPYEMWLGNTINNITTFVVVVEGVNKNLGVKIRGPPEDINIIALDMGENHPYIQGKMLAFANNEEVWFVYFNKQKNQYNTIVVLLEEGGMRPGPVQVGYGIDEGGLFVITAPKRIVAGDVINQAAALNDGSFGPAWFKFEPGEPTKVAMLK